MLDPGPISASPDDIVMQIDGNANPQKGVGSPVVNDLSNLNALGVPQTLNDLSYTWMFTGKQTDVDNGMVFDGDIVLFQNRPFALDSSPSGTPVVAGETVVEAIWGYGVGAKFQNNVVTTYPYSQNTNTVLLRWNSALQADPDVRVGGWIADVTYERLAGTEASRWYGQSNWSTYYPGATLLLVSGRQADRPDLRSRLVLRQQRVPRDGGDPGHAGAGQDAHARQHLEPQYQRRVDLPVGRQRGPSRVLYPINPGPGILAHGHRPRKRISRCDRPAPHPRSCRGVAA